MAIIPVTHADRSLVTSIGDLGIGPKPRAISRIIPEPDPIEWAELLARHPVILQKRRGLRLPLGVRRLLLRLAGLAIHIARQPEG